MSYEIRKLTYSDGRAYRYHISDEAGNLQYVAERTGLLLPSPTRLVEFFDTDQNLSGRLQPPDIAPWLRATRYEILVGEEDEPFAVIRERWRLVDILLLRLPRYEVQLGDNYYVFRGSRYSEHFYEILHSPEGIGADEEEGKEEEETLGLEDLEELEDLEDLAELEEAKEEEEKDVTVDVDLDSLDEEEVEEDQPEENKVGQIEHPAAGPSYIIETDAAPLRQALLVLAALAILIDMELYS